MAGYFFDGLKSKIIIKPAFLWVLILLGIFMAAFFLLTGLRVPQSDGTLRYQTFLTLFSDNPEYSKYSTIQPFLAKLVDHSLRLVVPSLPDDIIPRLLALLTLATFIGCAAASAQNRQRALILGALLPLSMMSHYLGQFFSEAMSAAFFALGFLTFLNGARYLSALLGSFIVALGLANWFVLLAPMGVIVCMALLGLVSGREKDHRFIVFLLAASVLAGLFLVLDLWFKGHLFDSPYASSDEAGFKTVMPYSGAPGFSHPLLIGLMGSLFSFGKSIFLFNPFLIFLFVRNYKYKPYMLAGLVSALLIYSQWWAWYGGFSFGTRFYIFAIIPSIFVFLLGMQDENRRWKGLEVAAVLTAIWLAVCGKYFGLDHAAGVCTQNNYAMEALCWYVPEFTPLINPIVTHGLSGVFMHVVWYDYLYIATVLCLYLALRLQPQAVMINYENPS